VPIIASLIKKSLDTPCPYCASKNVKNRHDMISGNWYVECVQCKSRGPIAKNGGLSLKRWINRKSPNPDADPV
jgi:hypothetical protein